MLTISIDLRQADDLQKARYSGPRLPGTLKALRLAAGDATATVFITTSDTDGPRTVRYAVQALDQFPEAEIRFTTRTEH